jgi:hypothetical protein
VVRGRPGALGGVNGAGHGVRVRVRHGRQDTGRSCSPRTVGRGNRAARRRCERADTAGPERPCGQLGCAGPELSVPASNVETGGPPSG